jgi:hypothetical protein
LNKSQVHARRFYYFLFFWQVPVEHFSHTTYDMFSSQVYGAFLKSPQTSVPYCDCSLKLHFCPIHEQSFLFFHFPYSPTFPFLNPLQLLMIVLGLKSLLKRKLNAMVQQLRVNYYCFMGLRSNLCSYQIALWKTCISCQGSKEADSVRQYWKSKSTVLFTMLIRESWAMRFKKCILKRKIHTQIAQVITKNKKSTCHQMASTLGRVDTVLYHCCKEFKQTFSH